MKLIARFRCQNEKSKNKFWMKHDESMYGEGRETVMYMLSKCVKMKKRSRTE